MPAAPSEQEATASDQAKASGNFITRAFGTLSAKLESLFFGNTADLDDMEDDVVVALILWFFFGGIAIHRVAMGGTPLLILLYLITIGGLFGLLPIFDLINLIVNPDKLRDNDEFIVLPN
jgi:hypothetical protein